MVLHKDDEFDDPDEISVGVALLTGKGKFGCVLKVVMEVLGAERCLHLAREKAK